jgi:hypothetical protein
MSLFPHNISPPSQTVIELPLSTRWMAAALDVQLVMFNDPESPLNVEVVREETSWRVFVNTSWPLHVHQLRLFLEALLQHGSASSIPKPEQRPLREGLLRSGPEWSIIGDTLREMSFHRN